MTIIYVDADACPVKDEVVRVAQRHGLEVNMVSNSWMRTDPDPRIKLVVVDQGPDVADDWIAEHIGEADICITNDIPLAGRCLKQGAFALKANGETYTDDSIGMALATREIMQGLRETGEITSGPRPFSKADRSKFLDRLEVTVQAAKRA